MPHERHRHVGAATVRREHHGIRPALAQVLDAGPDPRKRGGEDRHVVVVRRGLPEHRHLQRQSLPVVLGQLRAKRGGDLRPVGVEAAPVHHEDRPVRPAVGGFGVQREERVAVGVEVHRLAVDDHVDDLRLEPAFALEVLSRHERRRLPEAGEPAGGDEHRGTAPDHMHGVPDVHAVARGHFTAPNARVVAGGAAGSVGGTARPPGRAPNPPGRRIADRFIMQAASSAPSRSIGGAVVGRHRRWYREMRREGSRPQPAERARASRSPAPCPPRNECSVAARRAGWPFGHRLLPPASVRREASRVAPRANSALPLRG